MRTPILLLAALLLAPSALAAADPARFAYDLRDASGDVVQVAASGAEVPAARPAVDITRMQTALEGDKVRLTLTFAAAPPQHDLRVHVGAGLSTFEWDSENLEAAPGVVMTRTGSGIALVFPAPQAMDMETLQARPAECLVISVRVQHEPADDPATQTEAAAQGWMDRTETEPSWCAERVIPDGLNGSCPAPRIPAGLSVQASLTDPADDVVAGFPAEHIAKPASDLRSFDASLVDGRVVLRIKTAAAPFDESMDVTMNFEAPEVEGFPAAHHVAVAQITGTASGIRQEEAFSVESEPFHVFAQPESDGVTYSFCASVIPPDAKCIGYAVTLSFREPQRGFDELRPASDACAGKSMGGASMTTTTPPPTGTGESATRGTPSNAPTGDADVDDDTPSSAGENGAPGPGLPLLLAALAAAAVGTRARRSR